MFYFLHIFTAIIIYNFCITDGAYNLSVATTILLMLSVHIAHFLIFMLARHRISRLLSSTPQSVDTRVWMKEFSIFHYLLKLTGVIFYGIEIYLFLWKSFIFHQLHLKEFTVVPEILGITPFFLFLMVLWNFEYWFYKITKSIKTGILSYIWNQFRFNAIVLIPWGVLLVIVNLIRLLPDLWAVKIQHFKYINFVYLCVVLGIQIVFVPVILRRIWRCRTLKDPDLRGRLENFMKNHNIKYRDIIVLETRGSSIVTAGVVGPIGAFRYIFYTDTILELLNADELEAVMTHELGHIKHNHLIFYIFLLAGFFVLAWTIVRTGVFMVFCFYPAYALLWRTLEILNFQFLVTFVSFCFIILFVLYIRYIFGFFSRLFERQADIYSIELTGTARHLIRSLEKIGALSRHIAKKKNWHHYSIYQRIVFLMDCETDHRIIHLFHKKVRKSLNIFIILCIILIAYSFWITEYCKSRGNLLGFYIKHVQTKLRENPQSVELRFQLAYLYYELGDYRNSASEYERVIRRQPQKHQALNNLAWLYVTCKDKKYRNPDRALLLARKAVDLSPLPEYLDTLAEAYYQKGYIELAIKTIKRALSKNPENRSYFESQLRKFEKARSAKSQSG